jgi:hypothetical protein
MEQFGDVVIADAQASRKEKTANAYANTPECGLFCLSWKWRKRSFVKITERTYEKRAQALHC